MYNFTDTIEASGGMVMPSEAMQINGEYIEDLIEGYRTLTVSGRESLAPELSTFTTGVRDGARILSKRYPERVIVVQFQLIAKTPEDFRASFNKLGKILDVENARLIFNDEPDKFFVGTPCYIGEITPGRCAVVGEIEILCVDPFKYSILEHEAEANLDDSSILIDYGGTYKAFPILEADFYPETEVGADGVTAGTLTGKGDCGYVAFYTEDEKIIQLGNPEEVDGEAGAFAKSQTLMNQTFLSNTAWGTTAKALWAVNSGAVLPADVAQTGSVAMAAALPYTPPNTSGTLLKIKSTASSPAINYTVTAKATNRTASGVKVSITITASLAGASNYFGNGYTLTAGVYIGGAWRTVTLKKSSDYWKGQTAHSASVSVTLSGLSASQTSISGIRFRAQRPDGLGQSGVVAETNCSDLKISAFVSQDSESYYLTASSYGSDSWYHGPSITRTLSADASGVVGATDFTLTYKQLMCIGSGSADINQLGGFHCHLTDAAGHVVAGVRIVKNQQGSRAASLQLYVNGQKVNQVGIDLAHNSPFFGTGSNAVKTSTITKSGATIKFNVGGYAYTATDEDIADAAVVKVTYAFEQYSNVQTLTHNGLFWAKFVKNNCSTLNDIPNKFSAGDVLEADCSTGEIRLNGILSPSLGALGNDWEGFFLAPGLNQIGFSYSEWVGANEAPTIKVRYREVFL